MPLPSHPILSCEAAGRFEQSLFAGDEAREWTAMQRAGTSVGAAVVRDYEEIGGFPAAGKILVLAGKGHNAGDALIAAGWLLRRFPAATTEVLFVFGERSLRPLTARAWRELFGERVRVISSEKLTGTPSTSFDLCLDGVFGFQFRAPADSQVSSLLSRVNEFPIRFRAAIDLPSAGLFQADFAYATGSVKTPVLDGAVAGRIRYLDLGFFVSDTEGVSRVLTTQVLSPLAQLRPPHSDKRSYGHLFVLGGSRSYPGAVLMAVLAALRAGVGLVTAFVPESLVGAFAARVPEAIWVGWPETPDGGLALEGLSLLHERLERANALLIGPGISRDCETAALIKDIVSFVKVPALLDADALQPEIIENAKTALVLTPHAGEFERIAGNRSLEDYVARGNSTVVLKGPITRIASSSGPQSLADGKTTMSPIYHSFFGGPVLARGGSGDLLAGMIGGLLAQTPADPLLAAARGVVWHGLAAEHLARTHGQVAVNTTQLLDFVSAALRELSSGGL